MEITFTKHAKDKFPILSELGWKITPAQVKNAIKQPQWKGQSRFGQETAMSLLDEEHILRVIFNHENDKIVVVTFHVARRGKYESTI